MTPSAELGWIAFRLRLERAAGYWIGCIGGGAAIAGLVHHWLPLAVGNVVGLAVAAGADRFRRITPRQVAEHLDRALPELEESATLLLPGRHETGLALLQARRISTRWDVARVHAAVPHHELRRGLLAGVALGLLGVALAFFPVLPSPGTARSAPARARATLAVQSLTAVVTPPAYTQAPRRRLAGDDLEVEEGSRLRWEAEVVGPAVAVWLSGSAGDSLPLVPAGGARWRAEQVATRSQLWRLRAAGADTLRAQSADLRLGVKPDRPPALTVIRPEERTQLEPAQVAPLAVELLATDDYGVDSAALSVTIATGRGEAVRFRRLRLPFARRERGPAGATRLHATLDLPGLGLGPGDELYFTAEATDRREPVPNRSRSGTVFIAVRDTARPPTADLARMAIGVEPEYFRSQRQLIIDTEKLLLDQPRIAVQVFRDRSSDIGMDQGLLKLRYGQFLGEEFEEESSDIGEVHAHDDPENATLLGQSVKDKLRAAVSAMWQAELHLRTYEPRTALPFMYRALDLIKQVQQDARVYVQRVGFEPAPIEVGRIRLTGKLTDLAGAARRGDIPPQVALPAIRAALATLTAGDSAALRPALEAAGPELAALAVEDPARLGALRHLRRLLDALAAGAPCNGCGATVARELYAALPDATPRATPERPAGSAVGARFQRLLRGAP